MPGAAGGADGADEFEDHVLGRDVGREAPGEVHPERLRALLREALGRQDVLDLRGADAEGQRPEGAVGGGVRIAADDGRAGQGQAQLRPDDVDDALAVAAQIVEGHAEVTAVSRQRVDLRLGDGIADVYTVGRRDVVIHRREGQLRTAHLPAAHPQALEGLGAGHLMDEVPVDVQEVPPIGQLRDDVAIPDFLKQGLVHLGILIITGEGEG